MTTPTIIVDTREQCPLVFDCPTVVRALPEGDYSAEGIEHAFIVERKTVGDLVGSLSAERDRFRRELLRLNAYPFRRLLVVGRQEDILSGRYRSKMNPRAIIHSLHAIEARGCPVAWADTAENAAALVKSWAAWSFREHVLKPSEFLRRFQTQSHETTTK